MNIIYEVHNSRTLVDHIMQIKKDFEYVRYRMPTNIKTWPYFILHMMQTYPYRQNHKFIARGSHF